ncbi:MAG: AAA family ATPase [Armatimonadota bacterium]
MKIKFIEIQNFRKLKSCRIDFADETTVFVGANNSGKTSAMAALYKFLCKKNNFSTTDFTLSNWIEINKIGSNWEKDEPSTDSIDISLNLWEPYLPSMDIWLEVADNEIHHVIHLIPTLDWKGGLLGVRLRLEPKQMEELFKDYCASRKSTNQLIKEYEDSFKTGKETTACSDLRLWPRNMQEFLEKRLNQHFALCAYTLDPSKLAKSEAANPQETIDENRLDDLDPFKGLILINTIDAQRGFSDSDGNIRSDENTDSSFKLRGCLSSQLRSYYDKHLNPMEFPDVNDMDALKAIEEAQQTFDKKLSDGFSSAIGELESLGYPGFSDPRITISTKIRPIEGLNHNSAVQYELNNFGSNKNENLLRLPEQHNGLGYQNLISMVFRLMRFRDEWMKVGKVAQKAFEQGRDSLIQPLHLVLIEEPEAYLHMQVQQVFIRKAYEILRKHDALGENAGLSTQLIVSTHSSHIAHEIDFSCLRYFRRKRSRAGTEVPTSTVVNLSDVFGPENETLKFAARYLKSTHCDLFFADAAMIVEGPAERILLPHFIRQHFQKLDKSYISLLEIGGSHAHRLRPLIEKLGLTTLIITDLDAVDVNNNRVAVQPERGKEYETRNSTIKEWVPAKSKIDALLDLKPEEKIKEYNDSRVRASYQYPITIKLKDKNEEALPYTFEDALIFENLETFRELEGTGLIAKCKQAIVNASTVSGLGTKLFNELGTAKKAEFALELLFLQDPNALKVPTYIAGGLSWLEQQLDSEQTIGSDASKVLAVEKANVN